MGRKSKKKASSCAKEHGPSPSDSDDSVSQAIRQHHLRLAADRLTNADTFRSELADAHAQFHRLREQYNKDHKLLFDAYTRDQQQRVREFFRDSTHQHARIIKMLEAGLGFATDLVETRGILCTAEVDLLTQVIRANEVSANARIAVLVGAMEDKVAAVLRDWKVSNDVLVEDYNKIASLSAGLSCRVASLEEQVRRLQSRSIALSREDSAGARGRLVGLSAQHQSSRDSSVDSMRDCLRRDDVVGAVRHAQRVAELARGSHTPRQVEYNVPPPLPLLGPPFGCAHDGAVLLPQYLASGSNS